MTDSFYQFHCPVKILAGHAALEHVPFEMAQLGVSRPLLVTDPGVRAAGLIDPLARALGEADVAFAASFDDVPADSSTHVVSACARAWRDARCDSIIAVGGGSVIDTSKGANILVSENAERLEAFAGAGALRRPLRPLMVVPTTSGTGSEVTLAAVIADPDRGVKHLFSSPFLYPNLAVLDPRMTLTLPPHLTAATGMDALTHAIEAYIDRAKNPLSDAYAVAAIRAISENLLAVIDKPGDAVLRLALAQAATLAGIAFSNSMTGLVHAAGHSIGALCHVHHGVCMSLVLPYALEHLLPVRGREIGELLLPLAGAEAYARTPAADRGRAAITTIRTLRDALHAKCRVPRTLSETGRVRRDQLPQIARRTLDDGALGYAPKSVTYDEALALLERAW